MICSRGAAYMGLILGRIETIPLAVQSRATGQLIKNAQAQLRIVGSDFTNPIELTAACEEGIFFGTFTQSDLKMAKTKEDCQSSDWENILKKEFSDDVSKFPLKEEVELWGKLTSLEEYGESGALVGTELSADIPEFELQIRSKGTFFAVYGLFQLILKDIEAVPDSDRQEFDMLAWLALQSSKVTKLTQDLQGLEAENRDLKEALVVKEEDIETMEEDYRKILEDLEDRYYQDVISKKKKILELQGEDPHALDSLNQVSKLRNATNLNQVLIENISYGGSSSKYATIKKRRVSSKKNELQQEKTMLVPSSDINIKLDATEYSQEDDEGESGDDVNGATSQSRKTSGQNVVKDEHDGDFISEEVKTGEPGSDDTDYSE